jgi:hypothetical protein
MPTVIFLGKVHPDILQVSISDPPTVNWTAGDLGLEMAFKIKIERSDIRVECEVNRFDAADMLPIWMRAFDLVRGAVDLVCFATGIGATVTLDRLINPEGVHSAILPQDKSLAALCTAFRPGGPPNQDFNTVLHIVFKEPSLFMALNDLIVAITLPHHSPVACARAIERLRHIIAPGVPPKDSWESLRNNLRVEKDYLTFITGHSAGPRHGAPQHIARSAHGLLQQAQAALEIPCGRDYLHRKEGHAEQLCHEEKG